MARPMSASECKPVTTDKPKKKTKLFVKIHIAPVECLGLISLTSQNFQKKSVIGNSNHGNSGYHGSLGIIMMANKSTL